MFRYPACLSACLLAVFIAAYSLPQQQSRNTAHSSGQSWISDSQNGSNLLYIIPKDVFITSTWSRPDPKDEISSSGEMTSNERDQTVFYIRDFKPEAGDDPFYSLIGEDWIVVPVDPDESLFRLIATHASGKEGPLPKLRLDKQYRLEQMPAPNTWSEKVAPAKVLLAWAEWWQNETNATPVVLILMQF